MIDRYILNANGEPEPCEDLLTWGKSMQNADARRVGYTLFDSGYVSTVFLGLDHSFGSGLPVLWETMIFGGPHADYQERYTSRADAEVGHQRAVELATKVAAVDPHGDFQHGNADHARRERTPVTTISRAGDSDRLTVREAIRALFEDYDLDEHIEMVRDDAKYDPAFQGLSAEHPRVLKFREVCRVLRAELDR